MVIVTAAMRTWIIFITMAAAVGAEESLSLNEVSGLFNDVGNAARQIAGRKRLY